MSLFTKLKFVKQKPSRLTRDGTKYFQSYDYCRVGIIPLIPISITWSPLLGS